MPGRRGTSSGQKTPAPMPESVRKKVPALGETFSTLGTKLFVREKPSRRRDKPSRRREKPFRRRDKVSRRREQNFLAGRNLRDAVNKTSSSGSGSPRIRSPGTRGEVLGVRRADGRGGSSLSASGNAHMMIVSVPECGGRALHGIGGSTSAEIQKKTVTSATDAGNAYRRGVATSPLSQPNKNQESPTRPRCALLR